MFDIGSLTIVDIVTYVIYAVGLGVVTRIRSVSDKNIMTNFNNVKSSATKLLSTADNIRKREIDVVGSISKLNQSIDNVQNQLNESILQVNNSVLEFSQSEFVAEMRDGVAMIKEFREVLAQKDETIQSMMTEFKTITKELQEINNKLRV